MEHRLYVFLLPVAEQAAEIQRVLDELAAELGGPTFPAHVTAYAGVFEDLGSVMGRLDELAAARAPITLSFQGVGVGSTFTQCLYARMGPAERVAPITEAVRPLARPPAGYELRPHLSLYYGTREAVEPAAGRVAFPFDEVTFDRHVLIRPAGRSLTADVVAGWEQIDEARLVGSGE